MNEWMNEWLWLGKGEFRDDLLLFHMKRSKCLGHVVTPGQILIALGSWCVSSDCGEPRCPPGGAGGTSWGIRRSDLCWLCDLWRSDGGPKDSFSKFMLKYDSSVLSICFSMRFNSIKAEWRNSESSVWAAEAWNTGYKSVMTEVSLVGTCWNALSHWSFFFSPSHESFGQRCTNWTDQLSHLIPACMNTGGASQQNPSPIRPNVWSVNTRSAPHVETSLSNPLLSHRLAPRSYGSSINLLAVLPSGGHLFALGHVNSSHGRWPHESHVPEPKCDITPLCLITQTQPRSSRRLEFNCDETKRVHAYTRAVTGPKGLGHNIWLGLQSRAVRQISLLL